MVGGGVGGPPGSGCVHKAISPLAQQWLHQDVLSPFPGPCPSINRRMSTNGIHSTQGSCVPHFLKRAQQVRAGILADEGPWQELGRWGTMEMEQKPIDFPLKKNQMTLRVLNFRSRYKDFDQN